MAMQHGADILPAFAFGQVRRGIEKGLEDSCVVSLRYICSLSALHHKNSAIDCLANVAIRRRTCTHG